MIHSWSFLFSVCVSVDVKLTVWTVVCGWGHFHCFTRLFVFVVFVCSSFLFQFVLSFSFFLLFLSSKLPFSSFLSATFFLVLPPFFLQLLFSLFCLIFFNLFLSSFPPIDPLLPFLVSSFFLPAILFLSSVFLPYLSSSLLALPFFFLAVVFYRKHFSFFSPFPVSCSVYVINWLTGSLTLIDWWCPAHLDLCNVKLEQLYQLRSSWGSVPQKHFNQRSSFSDSVLVTDGRCQILGRNHSL